MSTQKRRLSRKKLPQKKQITHETPKSTNQPDLAKLVQRAKDAPNTLTKPDVLQLQRSMGNQAVIQLLRNTIQRDQYDTPTDFIAWFKDQDIYKSNLSNEGGKCAPSAKAIGTFLKAMFAGRDDVKVEFRGISLLTPFTIKAAQNMPHFVVTVTWGNDTIVIDPTQEQFQGGVNQIKPNSDWESGFAELVGEFFDGNGISAAIGPKVYDDFDTFDKANTYVLENRYKTDNEDAIPCKKKIGKWAPAAANIKKQSRPSVTDAFPT